MRVRAGVGLVWRVAPAALIDLGDVSFLLGREATWVGHGLSGTGRTGELLPPEFRAFTNVIDVVGTIETPPYSPPLRNIWQNFDKSSAVEKIPALPATPPNAAAVGSCTLPRKAGKSGR